MDNNVNTNDNVGQISLMKLWEVLKKYLVWIVLAAVVVGCATAIVTQVAIKDTYSCSIEYQLSDLIDYTGTELNYMGTYVDDAIDKLGKTLTIERVVDHAGIVSNSDDSNSRAAINQMKSATKISANSKGNGFAITVTTNNPKVSFAMVQAYKDLMPDLVEEYGLKSIEVKESPYSAPTSPSNKNRAIKYGLIGAVAGAVALYAIFLVRDLFDITIRTEADLKKYLNIPVIGMIPQYTGDGIPGDKGAYKYSGYSR